VTIKPSIQTQLNLPHAYEKVLSKLRFINFGKH